MDINEILTAMRGQRISDTPAAELRKRVGECIEEVYAWRSYKDKTDIPDKARRVSESLKRTYSGLTVEEVRLALTLGVQGEFGQQSYTLTPADLVGWVKSYSVHDDRRSALAIHTAAHRSDSTLPESERAKRNTEAVNRTAWRVWNEMKTDGHIDTYHAAPLVAEVWRRLESYGMVDGLSHEKAGRIYADNRIRGSVRDSSLFVGAMEQLNPSAWKCYFLWGMLEDYLSQLIKDRRRFPFPLQPQPDLLEVREGEVEMEDMPV